MTTAATPHSLGSGRRRSGKRPESFEVTGRHLQDFGMATADEP